MEVEKFMNSDKKLIICGEECIVCNQQKEIGIHLYTSFICQDCEREMVKTNTNESKYRYFVQQLRRVKTSQILS